MSVKASLSQARMKKEEHAPGRSSGPGRPRPWAYALSESPMTVEGRRTSAGIDADGDKQEDADLQVPKRVARDSERRVLDVRGERIEPGNRSKIESAAIQRTSDGHGKGLLFGMKQDLRQRL